MSAEALREAAALMRSRAEATVAPHHPYSDVRIPEVTTSEGWQQECLNYLGGEMGEHCASWHPAVALAVADWLDAIASRWQQTFTASEVGAAIITRQHHALIVARAYLGTDQ